MQYVFGKIVSGPNACSLSALQNVEDDYELLRGISRKEEWPDSAFFSMDPSFPDDILLEDFLFNTNGVLVVSNNVKSILDKFGLMGNEWLPVQIKNHKGRIEKFQYYILHQIQLQLCIDIEKSIVIENKINPEFFMRVRKLVIDESNINQELKLFRMARYPSLPLFDRELSDKIIDAELSGIVFGEIDNWKGR